MLGQNRSGPGEKTETGRGINFPLPYSCMQRNYICRRITFPFFFLFKTKRCRGERGRYLARRRRSLVEADGGVVAYGRRLRAALWLFPRGGERERVLVLFPSPLFFVSSFSVRLTRDHSLLFSVLFKKTSFCSFCFPIVSLPLQFFRVLSSLLSPFSFKETILFPRFLLHVRGKERGTVPFKTAPFSLSFFFLKYETASFWRKRAVSFKCGARTRQCSDRPPNYFCSFQLRPCQFRSLPP